MLLRGRLSSGRDRVHPLSVVAGPYTQAVRLAAAASTTQSRGATGWFLALLIVVGLVYVAWRSGALARWWAGARRMRARGELKGVRVRPAALIPGLLLLIVVVLLLIEH